MQMESPKTLNAYSRYCWNCGAVGWLGVTQGHRDVAIRQRTHDFLIDFNRNYASIFYRFLFLTSYLSKVTNVKRQPTQSSFGATVCVRKLELCSAVCVLIRLAVSVSS